MSENNRDLHSVRAISVLPQTSSYPTRPPHTTLISSPPTMIQSSPLTRSPILPPLNLSLPPPFYPPHSPPPPPTPPLHFLSLIYRAIRSILHLRQYRPQKRRRPPIALCSPKGEFLSTTSQRHSSNFPNNPQLRYQPWPRPERPRLEIHRHRYRHRYRHPHRP